MNLFIMYIYVLCVHLGVDVYILTVVFYLFFFKIYTLKHHGNYFIVCVSVHVCTLTYKEWHVYILIGFILFKCMSLNNMEYRVDSLLPFGSFTFLMLPLCRLIALLVKIISLNAALF